MNAIAYLDILLCTYLAWEIYQADLTIPAKAIFLLPVYWAFRKVVHYLFQQALATQQDNVNDEGQQNRVN